jgi:predicted P-loop ATPase
MADPQTDTAAGCEPAAAEGVLGSTTGSGNTVGQDQLDVKSEIAAACKFLKNFHGDDLWPLTCIAGATVEANSFDTAATAATWIAFKSGRANVYFNPATPGDRLTTKVKKEGIASTRWLWADADPLKLDEVAPEKVAELGEDGCKAYYLGERAELLRAVDALSPPPTVVLESGNGYQCFWRLKEPLPCTTAAEIEEVEARNRWLGAQFGGRADNTQNVDRIMRLPGTKNLPTPKKRKAGITWVSEATVDISRTDWRREYDAADIPKLAGKQVAVVASPAVAVGPPRALADIPKLSDRLRTLIETGTDAERKLPFKSRSEALWAAVGGMLRAGLDAPTITAVILDPRNGISASVLDKGRSAESYAQAQVAKAIEKGLDFDKTKVGIVANYRNARLAIMKLDLVCEYDEFADQMRVAGHAMQEWQGDLTDNSVSILRQIILDRFGFDPKPHNVREATVALCLENSHNPVVERYARLEPTWDKVARLDTWLTDYMGAEDTPLNRAIGKRVLVAAVRRARKPGTKFDHVLIFEDEIQGKGKSSAVEILAGGPDNFSDEDLLDQSKKERIEALQGVHIYELGELQGMKTAQLASIKAFVTRRKDQVRPAYGRFKQTWWRQCIFIGSTNELDYLRDETGNRRWWPVATGAIDLKALARDVDQLWAEAAQAESAGFDIALPENLWAAATAEQDKRMPADAWTDVLAEVVGTVQVNDDGQKVERVKSTTIMTQWLKIDLERQRPAMGRRVGKVMRKLGWDGPEDYTFGSGKSAVKRKGYERPARDVAHAQAAAVADEIPF